MDDASLRARAVGASWDTVATAIAVGATLGCGQILDVDEYRVGHRNDASVEGGFDCADSGAQTMGDCLSVGVRDCGEAFAHNRRNGGCETVITRRTCMPNEILGANFQCESADTLYCPPGAEFPEPSGAGRAWYVGSDGARSGDAGTGPESPLASIQAAIDRAEPGDSVLVGSGTYAEDLVITKPIHLRGLCMGKVRIEGSGAERGAPCDRAGSSAAICFGPGAAGADAKDLTVTSPEGEGVAVVGAEDVRISLLVVLDTGRFGVRIEEAYEAGPTGEQHWQAASASLDTVAIHGATGAGIHVAGASADLDRVQVFGTRPENEYLAYGLSAVPRGTRLRRAVEVPAQVTVRGSAFAGNGTSAVRAAGSKVTLEESFLGNFADEPPLGRGVLAEAAIPWGTPSDVTLDKVEITRTRDAAVDSRNSHVRLVDTTIHDTFGRDGDGCSGQGVRTRVDPAGGLEGSLTVEHSAIVSSRQSAVHATGGPVEIRASLLSGAGPASDVTGACAPELGDGVTVDGADVTITGSRIEGTARAAAAAIRGTLHVDSTVLGACGGAGGVVVDEGDAATPATVELGADTWCGCGEAFRECALSSTPLSPWISPGAAGARSGGTTAHRGVTLLYGNPAVAVSGLLAWGLDYPEVRPVVSQALLTGPDAGRSDGCFTLAGVPAADPYRLAVWAPGYLPVVAELAQLMASQGACDANVWAPQSGLGSAFEAGAQLWSRVDHNRGSIFSAAPPGLVFELSPKSGDFWFCYTGGGATTGAECASPGVTEAGSAVHLFNVDPGRVEVTLVTDAFDCTAPTGSSWSVPVPGKRNTVVTTIEPGFINNVSFACTPRSGP